MSLFMDVHNVDGGVSAADAVHQQAHGLVADEIYPVTEHS